MLQTRPEHATVSVNRAARHLGVHPNTIRSWTDQGRLPCLRINDRGDRRYRLQDLDAFLTAAGRDSAARRAATELRATRREMPSTPHGAVDLRDPDARSRSRVTPRPSAATPPARRASLPDDADAARHHAPEIAALQARLHRAEALQRISADISSKSEMRDIVRALMEHARVLFGAQRAAVYRQRRDGRFAAVAVRGLSAVYLEALRDAAVSPLGARPLPANGPAFSVGFADDQAAEAIRAAVVQEGFDTIAVAPLLADGATVGALALYHDRPHPWTADQLRMLDELAGHAATAVRNAQNYNKMATWAAQLHSIQQLGARLSRLTSVREIGRAIAAELQELIDYHNVRVYRVEGEDVAPVAWRGVIGEYTEEDEDQLRVKVGQGITGWVALHGVAENLPDAATDPRSEPIPGTNDEIPESMLLAPMRQDDRIIGVIVLSKLGTDQFSDDDLRLLEIYASFAAQAISHVDAVDQLHAQSERLARQLHGQRELLGITESILSTLDPRVVLEEIADRLGSLVGVDDLGIAVHDAGAGLLQPIIARGVHADAFMSRPLGDTEGIAGLVLRDGEARLVPDVLTDPHVVPFDRRELAAGSLIVAPLKRRDRVLGAMTLERIGVGAHFTDDEFELVKLFAAHVSIAIHNAQVHHAVELRAQTDPLTRLRNHGTFQDDLSAAADSGVPFSVLMLDLDDFKGYNDRHGHRAGDRLLERIARALETSGRDSDRVYRYGGDEFALILPNTDTSGAGAVASKVRDAVSAVGLDAHRGVSCSIGVAEYPADGADAERVVVAADRALYLAKRRGGDRVATAAEGAALAADVLLSAPTPVDEPTTVA